MAPSVTVRTVPANGIDIEVATAGEGPALLLLHGFPHTWRVWSAMIPELARTRRVIAAGPPWWFGFHAVPGLAETVLAGHEGAYLDFFYRAGTHAGHGIDPALRDAFVEAYSGQESL